MIDILLVLLVFFMTISSTEVLQIHKGITLPSANDARISRSENGVTIINVLWNESNHSGSLDMDEMNFDRADQIAPILARKILANPNMAVTIRADRAVRYEYLRSVMVTVGHAGVAKVTFSVVDNDPR